MIRRVLVAAIVSTLALSLAPSPSAQAGAFPGRNGKIVYVREDPGGIESISVITKGGGGKRNYVAKDANTEFPDASANGKMIVFDRYTPTNSYDIFRMSSTGKSLRNLTKDAANDWGPSISPDGDWIAFASNRDGDFDIWLMTVDGKKVHRLLDTGDDETEPQWSPDGKRILYVSDTGGGTTEISSVTAKGKGLIPLTTGSDDFGPVWSPNGKKIAFYRYGGNSDIWTMDADGSNKQNISTPDLSSQGYVAWSPDGKWLAYEQSDDIWVMRLNGADKTNVTNSPEVDTTPTWLPRPRR